MAENLIIEIIKKQVPQQTKIFISNDIAFIESSENAEWKPLWAKMCINELPWLIRGERTIVSQVDKELTLICGVQSPFYPLKLRQDNNLSSVTA